MASAFTMFSPSLLCMCVQEMPGDVDYINLGRMIVPLELNYCQCMLELEEYYEVIEHMDELLEKHKGTCLLGGLTGRLQFVALEGSVVRM